MKRVLFFTILTVLVVVSACSQETKKPKIQSSANTKETVYKPLKEAGKTSADQVKPGTDKKKAVTTAQKKKSTAKGKSKAAVMQTNKTGVKSKKTEVQVKKPKGKAQAASAQKGKASAKDKKATAQTKKVGNKKKATAVTKKKQAATAASDRYIALKTNIPFLAVAIQNLALEVELHQHISLDFPVMWSIGDIERRHGLRTFALQPEGRWWLKEVGTGHFFGLHAHAAWFNLKWEDNRYQSGKRPLLGAGISYGYKLPLSAHWGAEFNIGAGYANMKYNTYYNIENGAQLDTRVRHYWGITRAGISLVYRF